MNVPYRNRLPLKLLLFSFLLATIDISQTVLAVPGQLVKDRLFPKIPKGVSFAGRHENLEFYFTRQQLRLRKKSQDRKNHQAETIYRIKPDGSLSQKIALEKHYYLTKVENIGTRLFIQVKENPEHFKITSSDYRKLPVLHYPLANDGRFITSKLTPTLAHYQKILTQPFYTMADGSYYTINNPCLERFHADGTRDETFASGTEEHPTRGRHKRFVRRKIGLTGINALTIQANGHILVGGSIKIPDTDGIRTMLRLNPNGAIDPNFTIETSRKSGGDSTPVTGILLQADGKILITGNFKRVNHHRAPGIARLNPDGSIDENFHPPRKLKSINSLTLEADGSLFLNARIQKQTSFFRLKNDPASQKLKLNRSGVLTWTRSGSTPELTQTFIEIKKNDEWIHHSEMQRIEGGWQGTRPIQIDKARVWGFFYDSRHHLNTVFQEL